MKEEIPMSTPFGAAYHFTNYPNINCKELVLALLKSYRHHLLGDERNRLGAGFGMVWKWFWMVWGWVRCFF